MLCTFSGPMGPEKVSICCCFHITSCFRDYLLLGPIHFVKSSNF